MGGLRCWSVIMLVERGLHLSSKPICIPFNLLCAGPCPAGNMHPLHHLSFQHSLHDIYLCVLSFVAHIAYKPDSFGGAAPVL